MANTIKYHIDGIDIETAKPEQKVTDMLVAAKLSPEDVLLVGPAPDKTVYDDPNQIIKIQDQDTFTTRPRKDGRDKVITYKVNGEELKTDKTKLTVEEILKAAGKAASVNVSDLKSYYLERIEPNEKYDNLSDVVPLEDGSQFIAVHRGKTPVA